MKKLSVLLALMLSVVFLVSCGTAKLDEDSANLTANQYGYNDASTANFGSSGNTLQFISDGFRMDFVSSTSGYTIDVVNVSKSAKIFTSATPIKIYVKTNSALGSATESSFTGKYSTVSKQSFGYTAIGFVKTTNGSIFKVTDNYYLVSSKFVVDRTVKVLLGSNKDYGFESEFCLTSAISSPSIKNYLAFVPGNVYASKSGGNYAKTDTSTTDAVNDYTGGTFNPDSYSYYRLRESGTTLPMAMLYHSTYGSFTLSHYNPNISAPFGGGVHGEVNENIKYGSLGYTFDDSSKTAGIFYCYPAREEGCYTYKVTSTSNWFRYHPVYTGFSHSYSLSLIGGNETTYSNAMMSSYYTCYSMLNATIPNININTVYEQNIDLFSSECKEFGSGSTKAIGVPFAIDVTDARLNSGYNFCNGFVGQQIPMGYQLYVYGVNNGNNVVKAQGKEVLDFWSSSSITGDTSKFAYWKWISGSNSAGGKPETGDDRYYLRYVVDGSEGMLDAYAYAKAKGNTYSAWKDAGLQNANVLVSKQNSDGSFWRTYQKDGNQYGTDSAQSKLGTSYYGVCLNSKQTSMVPMRYLYKCYLLTGEQKYLTAANKCAEYCYNNFYSRGYYRGGATDLADLIDKEGAAFALYGFNAAYEVTGQTKYLEAAKQAGMLVMSFTYAYDFKIPNASDDFVGAKYNAFVNGGVIGESRISVYNDFCDNYSAYCYYDLYKLYAFTGDTTYYNYALLLQKATKASSDYDGRLGYAYKAMMLEATHLSNFFVTPGSTTIESSTSSTWLPWSGVAQIEPATSMLCTFGNMDASAITSSTSTLVTKIKNYGLGVKRA